MGQKKETRLLGEKNKKPVVGHKLRLAFGWPGLPLKWSSDGAESQEPGAESGETGDPWCTGAEGRHGKLIILPEESAEGLENRLSALDATTFEAPSAKVSGSREVQEDKVKLLL